MAVGGTLSFVAGAPWTIITNDVVVTAHDFYNNTVTSYAGSPVWIASCAGTLPAAQAFSSGTKTFLGTGFALNIVGAQNLTMTDGAIIGTSATITITPGALASFTISGEPASCTAGTAWTAGVVVTALDSYGNIKTDYTGQVYFTSTDTAAVLPYTLGSHYTFVAGTGTHTFPGAGFTLKTTASQTITITNGTISQTSATITVTPGPLVSFTMTGAPASCTAGTPWTAGVVVTALDAYSNVKIDYAGDVYFTSTDMAAVLPYTIGVKYTFVTGTGTHTFPGAGFILKTIAGDAKTITITNGTISQTSAAITINPGALDHFTVVGITDPVVAGALTSPTVTAYDAYNNINTTYTGTIHFSSTDVRETTVLPADYTFVLGDGGTHTFTSGVKLTTTGEQTVTVTNIILGKVGAQTVTVAPAALEHFTLVGIIDPVVAGVLTSPTVNAYDVYNNVKTDYTGTINFTSSDHGASTLLPANYSFIPADAGVKNFANGVKLTTTGEQWVRATDTVVGTAWGEQTAITVYTVSGAPALTSAIAGINSAVLAWIAPTDNGSTPITGYKVYYGMVDPTTQFGGTLPATNLTVSVTGLTAGTKYYFAVKAVNAAGDSLDSNIRNATVMTVPGTPTGPNARAIYGQVTLTWTVPASTGGSPITHYKVYRGLSAVSVAHIGNSTSTTFVDAAATAGSTYYYKVSAVNAVGEGAQCAAISVLVPTIVPVSGKIVDASGNGLAGIKVALENGTSVKTDAQGNFTIMASPGNHILTISGPGIETKTVAAKVTSSGLVIGSITTSPASDYMPIRIMLSVILTVVEIAVVLVAARFVLRKRKGKK
ncbi:MAG: fibronectin type III domain-containing protein [Methanomassiliicoccales archaeon]|nr:fibronectin type III domain-containing protein [Methanomassiliicoccales archaeon]